MKRELKNNQFTVVQSEVHKVRTINAIKIDVTKRTVALTPIENCIEYIQSSNNFFRYQIIYTDKKNECFIIGTDEDLKGDFSFKIRCLSDIFYGNAIVVKLPDSKNLHKLKSTKFTVEEVMAFIQFNQ